MATYTPPTFRSSGTMYSMVTRGRSFCLTARSTRRHVPFALFGVSRAISPTAASQPVSAAKGANCAVRSHSDRSRYVGLYRKAQRAAHSGGLERTAEALRLPGAVIAGTAWRQDSCRLFAFLGPCRASLRLAWELNI